ncbi:hypothetical protein MXB_3813 [Myxobolus squamalis]|nr:hypothetical protein MXB_3813 [Myxobolus squamalis]
MLAANREYIPTESDVIHVRAQTTGIIQVIITHNSMKFLLCDVGGQRSERKKWIPCFEGVTALLYVVDSSSYDQMTFEDSDNSEESGLDFIKEKFIEAAKTQSEGRSLVFYQTNATDIDCVKFVFNACAEIIIKSCIMEIGLG